MRIINQSAFDRWDIADESVQAIITSPPYYLCRTYKIPDVKIGDWTGQYGREPDFGSEYEIEEYELRDNLTEEEKKYVIKEILNAKIF